MSLDVYLTRRKLVSYDDGKTHEEQFDELYWANITHNLGEMADAAGIYDALWRPFRLKKDYDKSLKEDYEAESEFEDKTTVRAKEIIDIVEKGLEDMKARPEYYKRFNSPNGWGMYKHFVPFIEKYLEACKEHPEATIKISR